MTIFDPPGMMLVNTDDQDLITQIKEKLTIKNPDYEKKLRLGFWAGKTPKNIYMYIEKNGRLYIPYGSYYTYIKSNLCDCESHKQYELGARLVPLYDYQKRAVAKCCKHYCGILQAPTGSGKTQMGIGIIKNKKVKSLWITHTLDLLKQSKDRALQYIDKQHVGTIASGKIDIKTVTFATVQTLNNINLEIIKNEFDLIIVDECHRASGTESNMKMFSKVLNGLSATYKYGLSATVHRSDGMIETTHALLGNVIATVTNDDVGDKIMQMKLQPYSTGIRDSFEMKNTDGTLNYNGMLTYLTTIPSRNKQIVALLEQQEQHYTLVLSDRVEHLEIMQSMLSDNAKQKAQIVTGKTKKEIREKAIQDIRQGKLHYLFATYSLAKEGLDIPRLDRLFLTTPHKDYAIITQSIGRVGRTFEGKETPLIYDFVDNFRYSEIAFKKRLSIYNKHGVIR